MSNTATIPTPETELRRGAATLAAAGTLDFALPFLLPVALVRLLPSSAFADYRLAWLAIGTALAPFTLPRSLLYFLPRGAPGARAAYVKQSLLLLGAGALADLVLGPWNPMLPRSLRALESGAWFMPAFLTLWVAASLAGVLRFWPVARATGALLLERALAGTAPLAGALLVGAAYSASYLALLALAGLWPQTRALLRRRPAGLAPAGGG